MAEKTTKTIEIDEEAFTRLTAARRGEESVSQTILRVVPKPVDLDGLFRRMSVDPLSEEAVAAIEEQIAQRRGPQNTGKR